MQAERWQKIEQIFNASVKLPFHERESFVLENCGEDPELCQEIFNLISISEESDDFLSQPIFSLGAQLLDQEFEELLNRPIFGTYRLQKILGRGGVGAVFIAEDTRLGRQVALKILPSILDANDERVLRFQQEARTASSVSHQNIAHIYEFGEHNGHYYLAMEYIDGQTLRQYLKEKPPDIETAINFISQITKALTAAHRAGIIHRDIKPENIMITGENTVKVLDFGLAKPVNTTFTAGDKPSAMLLNDSLITTPGLIIGTAAYMSPEQAQGKTLDERTDLWSLGVLFYEMLLGKHPFHNDSNIETLHAILKEEPKDLEDFQKNFPPMLTRLVLRCLAKNRDERFQTANDFLFALESFQNSSRTSEAEKFLEKQSSTTRFWRWLAAALAAIILVATVLFLAGVKPPRWAGVSSSGETLPLYKELTFQKGTIWAARFAAGDQNVVYSATLNGNALDLFQVNSQTAEARPLHLPQTHLLSVSAKGEMAILQPRQYLYQYLHRGNLAVMPVSGGTPRVIAEDVQEADWSPDGNKLAVVRWVNNRSRLEYPIGTILYETNGYINCPRVSPDGNSVAFFDHKIRWDNRGDVAIVDLNGQKKTVSAEWSGLEGLAWSAKGDEIWFTGTRRGESYALYAADSNGRERTILRLPVNLLLHDINKDGRVLLSRTEQTTDIFGLFDENLKEKNLSWLNLVGIGDLSGDGKQFLFTNFAEGMNYATYIRSTDGSSARRLGEGRAMAFSPDGKFVLTKLSLPEQLLVLPVNEGEVKRLPHSGFESFDRADWFADGENIIFTATEPGRARRTYKQNLTTGEIQPLTPEGVAGTHLSPDQSRLVAVDEKGQNIIYFLKSGERALIKSIQPDEQIIGWHADGEGLLVFNSEKMPIKINRLNLEDGVKTLIRQIQPTDTAGIIGAPYVFLTPDGKECLYGLRRYMDNLYIVENLQ
jgi:eukaryotic-like serine/threonine-protein kinase